MWRAVKRAGGPRAPTPSRLAMAFPAHSDFVGLPSSRSLTRSPRRAPAASAHDMPLPPVLRSLLRTTPTVAPVPHRALLSITGSQAAEFLNGLTAASLPRHPHSHFYSAFLHAQVSRTCKNSEKTE